MALLALCPSAQAGLNDGRCDGSLPSRSERIIHSYAVSADGLELTVYHWSFDGYRQRRHSVVETPAGPRIEIHEQFPAGATPVPGCVFRSVTVRLASPLGDRKVIDGETGRNLPPGDGRPHRDCRDRYYAAQAPPP
jgi:hypothetical protein